MARCQLRVYYGPESAPNNRLATRDENTIRVRLGEILPHLVDAVRNERTWLDDFEDDDVAISTDLYEVILAYQHCRRPSA